MTERREFSPKPDVTETEKERDLLAAYEKEYGLQGPEDRAKLLAVFRGALEDKEIEEKMKKIDPERD